MGIPIRGTARGSGAAAYETALKRGAHNIDGQPGSLRTYFDSLYDDAKTLGINADVLVAQWDLETGSGTSAGWTKSGNPAGLGMFDDGSTMGLQFEPERAARAHVTHMALYAGITPEQDWIKTDARWEPAKAAGFYGTVDTTDDLGGGRWATDPRYASKLLDRYAAYFGAWDSEEGTKMKAYKFVGLAETAYLPDDIVFEVAIVPASVTNVRSNTKRRLDQVTSVTLHETANFNAGANADMHKRWLHGGAGGGYVGFNFVVDDKKIIQLTPLDEITWAAGTAEGNLTSDHIELCVNSDIDHAKARRNAAALCAALLKARKLGSDKLVPHRKWYGKDCPHLILAYGLWPTQVNMTAQFMVAIGTGGTALPDQPTNALKIGTKAVLTDAVNLRQAWGTSGKLITTLPAGTAVEIIDGPKTANGFTWYDVKGTFGTGWMAANWFQILPPEEQKPSTAWPYPQPVAPAWWVQLMKGTHIIDGGHLWVRTNDLYKAKRDTKRLASAIGSGAEVGPVLKQGTEFRSAAVGLSALDKKAYVITEGLTRVALDDLEYVAAD